MSIKDTAADWALVESIAQEHEKDLCHVETPKVPPTPSEYFIARLANSIKRKDTAISEAIMWLSVGDYTRAQEVLNRGLLDL